MITAKRTLVAARDYLIFLMSQSDSMLSVWQAAIAGEPVIVHNTKLQPSFWIVPVERDGKVLGQIDISPDSRVLGHSYMYHDPNDLSTCPSSVTRISAPEVLKLADQILKIIETLGLPARYSFTTVHTTDWRGCLKFG